jgi:D-alanyl-D-alanine carboxypeptidase/D-alanyl-D-alanine-endopeptidase (penicillin-binding protein 4)
METFSPVAFARENSEKVSTEISIQDDRYLCPANLETAIETVINRPEFARSRWGILIQTLDSGRTLYSLDADKYFIPASNIKLLTTAAALRELGANFRIETPLYIQGKPPILNALWLQGRGDPTISFDTLKEIAQQLKNQGVQRIEKLIVEDNYFSQPTINPSWEWSDIYNYYATSVNSLILNQNTITLTLFPQQLGEPVKLKWSDPIAARQWQVENQGLTAPKDTSYNLEIEGVLGEPILQIRGELAIDAEPDVWDLAVVDPANYFLESWRNILLREGIEVRQGVVAKKVLKEEGFTKLTQIISPSLKVLLSEINQESNNLFAEVLRQILNKKIKRETDLDSVSSSLTKLGIASENSILVDGSGLSRHNLITPEVLAGLRHFLVKNSLKPIYSNGFTSI